jgi:hypothetical protein
MRCSVAFARPDQNRVKSDDRVDIVTVDFDGALKPAAERKCFCLPAFIEAAWSARWQEVALKGKRLIPLAQTAP